MNERTIKGESPEARIGNWLRLAAVSLAIILTVFVLSWSALWLMCRAFFEWPLWFSDHSHYLTYIVPIVIFILMYSSSLIAGALFKRMGGLQLWERCRSDLPLPARAGSRDRDESSAA